MLDRKKKNSGVRKWRTAIFGPRYILLLLAVVSLLGQISRTEEWLLILAAAIPTISQIWAGHSESVASLIGGTFKAFLHT